MLSRIYEKINASRIKSVLQYLLSKNYCKYINAHEVLISLVNIGIQVHLLYLESISYLSNCKQITYTRNL